MFGSSVDPDLLETMTSVSSQIDGVVEGLHLRGVGRIEHMQLGVAVDLAKGRLEDLGHRLDPPMPSSRTASVKPPPRASSAIRVNR